MSETLSYEPEVQTETMPDNLTPEAVSYTHLTLPTKSGV